MRKLLLSLVAVALLASCSKDDVTGDLDLQEGKKTLVLTVKSADATTKAGGAAANGTAGENKISSVSVIGFDNAGTKIDVVAFAGTNLTERVMIGSETTKIFVVVNGNTSLNTRITNATTFNEVNVALGQSMVEVGEASTNDKFLMTNAGIAGVGTGAVLEDLVEVLVDDDVSTYKATVKVARVVSKVELAGVPAANDATGGAIGTVYANSNSDNVSVEGYLLNVTNKSYFPFSEHVAPSTTIRSGASAASSPSEYRIDPNYGFIASPAFMTTFNWLHNREFTVDGGTVPEAAATGWKTTIADPLYCLENTMDKGIMSSLVNPQNYNSTTKMIIQGTFTPSTVGAAKTSWFAYGNVFYTFAGVKALVAKSPVAKADFDAFVTWMFKTNTATNYTTFQQLIDLGGGTEGLDALDAIPNGGYLAATIDNNVDTPVRPVTDDEYKVAYYQKALCYYDVNLNHDASLADRELGRWGLVRNSWYSLTVDKISKPGFPYLPDPTDPDIVDPSNPDKDKPDPNDPEDIKLDVTLQIQAWRTWSQNVSL